MSILKKRSRTNKLSPRAAATLHRRKIIKIKDLPKLTAKLKKQGKKVITTNGCFDLLHIGHVRNFAYAKSLGDVLIVGLNSDASVRNYKGPKRPIVSEDERAEMVAALEPVDYVFIFEEPTPVEWLSGAKPHVHVKGGDWKKETMPEWSVVVGNGGKVVRVPLTVGYSTTNIIQKILDVHR